MRTVLFVCTGNTCRSPMAEVIFNKLMNEAGTGDIKAQSAGIAAGGGEPVSQNAAIVVQELGADLSGHKSRQVTREMIESSEAIFAMTQSHAALLKNAFPDYAQKINVLGSGIPDPFGGDIEVYRKSRDSILAAIKKYIEQVK